MIDGDEGRIGDDVQRLLAAIIGMGAPADVGKQTGGMAQALVVLRLVKMGGGHEGVRPGAQVLAVLRRARAQHIEIARRLDQRIDLAFGPAEPLMRNPSVVPTPFCNLTTP